MRIVFAASEVAPYSKTGGLGDVIGALPRALDALGEKVVVFSPLYTQVRDNARERGLPLKKRANLSFSVPIGDFQVAAHLVEGKLPDSGVTVYFLENDEYYDRPGLYTNPADGSDYQDNCERFTFLCRGAMEACKALGLTPDIIHCNDWQTGLIPVYLSRIYREDFPAAASIFTVHNIAYQGLFWRWDMSTTGLPWDLFNWKMLEYYGNLSFLKGGLVFSDALTTVSRQYAKELQTEEYGMGMQGVVKTRVADLYGIVNGVDYDTWRPETDRDIARNYSIEDLSGKKECKRALQAEFKLPQDESAPLIGMIGRLVDQKGFDLVVAALPEMVKRNAQLVALGTGEAKYHQLLTDMVEKLPGKVGVYLGFDEKLAHRIEAGADMFLMPSRFEPCGLNQLYSLRYGTVPIVSATGGLVDTVVDYSEAADEAGEATGFVFRPDSVQELIKGVDRAVWVYRKKPDTWTQLQQRGMKQDWSWNRSAQEYQQVYKKAVLRVQNGVSAPK